MVSKSGLKSNRLPCVSEQTFPDVLQYFLTITEQNYTLHLEKNK